MRWALKFSFYFHCTHLINCKWNALPFSNAIFANTSANSQRMMGIEEKHSAEQERGKKCEILYESFFEMLAILHRSMATYRRRECFWNQHEMKYHLMQLNIMNKINLCSVDTGYHVDWQNVQIFKYFSQHVMLMHFTNNLLWKYRVRGRDQSPTQHWLVL